jgi:hypothetical protein
VLNKSNNQWLDFFYYKMNKQVKKLEAFFKRKAVSHKDDDGDGSSFDK